MGSSVSGGEERGGMLSHRRRLFGSAARAAVLGILCAVLFVAIPAGAALELGIQSADYEILSANGSRTLGHNRYTVTAVAGGYLVKGEAKYQSGAYDVETERLKSGAPGALPRLTWYQHEFHYPGGSLQREIIANLLTGAVSCTRWSKGRAKTYGATLNIPVDTYAGASILLPLMRFVHQGGQGSVNFHVLYCAPRPRVYAVTGRVVTPKEPWPYYAGAPTEVALKPDLGWFNVIASPFVPKTYLYFSNEKGMQFVGGDMERFYKGPKIKLVKIKSPKDSQPTLATSPDRRPRAHSADR